MEIRPATIADRESVLNLCRSIYPEGDYVEDTWDGWFADKNAYVICQDDQVICTFNVSIRNGQGWMEGTRVHCDFRRRRVGTTALEYAEDFVRRRGGRIIRSLIEDTNVPSLQKSQKAGWKKQDMWRWYRLGSGAENKSFGQTKKRDLNDTKYADSWRIYDFDGTPNTVFFKNSAASIIPAKYFADTILVSVLEADDLSELAAYLHTIDVDVKEKHGWHSGIHVTSNCDESLFEGHFEKISSYYLMEKNI